MRCMISTANSLELSIHGEVPCGGPGQVRRPGGSSPLQSSAARPHIMAFSDAGLAKLSVPYRDARWTAHLRQCVQHLVERNVPVGIDLVPVQASSVGIGGSARQAQQYRSHIEPLCLNRLGDLGLVQVVPQPLDACAPGQLGRHGGPPQQGAHDDGLGVKEAIPIGRNLGDTES